MSANYQASNFNSNSGLSLDDREGLVQFAFEGMRIINTSIPDIFFAATDHLPLEISDLKITALLGEAKLQHIDQFYSNFSTIIFPARNSKIYQLPSSNKIQQDIRNFIEKLTYRENHYEKILSKNLKIISRFTDSELSKILQKKFTFLDNSLLTQSTEKSFFYTKVNHGYWENIRGMYCPAFPRQKKFRKISKSSMFHRYYISGVSRQWGASLSQLFNTDFPSKQISVNFSASLSAGTESPLETLVNGFTPLSRSAAVGFLATFETIGPTVANFEIGNGADPKALIIKAKIGEFHEKYLQTSDACLIVAPPHLKNLRIQKFKGQQYNLMCPPGVINENWKVFIAILTGYVSHIAKKHRTLTVLSQGASIASLAGLILSRVSTVEQCKVRYFDLGRALDVAIPEVLKNQDWARGKVDDYVYEGRKAFYIEQTNS